MPFSSIRRFLLSSDRTAADDHIEPIFAPPLPASDPSDACPIDAAAVSDRSEVFAPPAPEAALPADATTPIAAGPVLTWLDYFDEANWLHREGDFTAAAGAYRRCFEAGHPYPAEALSSSLLCRLKNGDDLEDAAFDELAPFDPAYPAYLRGVKLLLRRDPAGAIHASGNAYESFHTGTEPDRFFLNAAGQYFGAPAPLPVPVHPYGDYGRARIGIIPNNLFFYWNINPPAEVADNFERHRLESGFNVQVYDRQRAEAFLYDYFGRETKTQFNTLRHPAEEADYFRAHLLYAYGGFYLDADLRLRQAALQSFAMPQPRDAAVFETGGMLIHNDFFIAAPGSRLMAECINVITANCAHFPSLRIELKTGPGAFTRAVNRLYFRRIAFAEADPGVLLFGQDAFESIVEEYPVSYKQDGRNWQAV